MDCLEFRIDEKLLGRLMVAKIKGTDGFENETNLAVRIQSTVLPDIKFESFVEWKKYVHDQSALIERQKNTEKEKQKQMSENIEYYSEWLNNKFKRQ